MAKPFKINHFDNRVILVPINEIINPKSIIKIEKEGLIYNGGKNKGDLYI